MRLGRYRCQVARLVVDITPLRKHRHFRRLWAGQMVSGMGSQLTLVAVSFQAYGLTHSTLVVGLIGLGQLVPLLAGALWGGTLADAIDRRRVLILTQVAMATAVGGLVINASLSHPAVWPLFVCTAAGSRVPGGRLAGAPGGSPHAGRTPTTSPRRSPCRRRSNSSPWWPAPPWPACSSPPSG